MKKVIIIGGGIAGLAAAYRLQEEIQKNAAVTCTVLEGSDRFGGKIHTLRRDGFIIERGPDSFISQKPWAIELCRKLGIGDHLVGTKTDHPQTFVYINRKMVTMPDGLSLMVPTKFLPFATTRLFTWPGKIRMGMDVFLPKKRGNSDESLASFVRRRLGQEALERMGQPLMAGIYASDPETMSLHTTFPMFAQVEKKHRSLILGMLAAKRKRGNPAPPKDGYKPFSLFLTLKNGLSEMVETVIEKSPDVLFRNNARVESLLHEGNGWQVRLKSGETLTADAVIVSTPANRTARLVADWAPEVAGRLDQIPYVSTAAVVLGFRKDGFSHPLRGFGFVVPHVEKRRITACTWVSSKFPERAPDDRVLLRAFVGGAVNEALAEQDEEALKTLVREELRDIMGIREEPLFCEAFQYKKGNVQYHVNHGQLIAGVEQELERFPGLYLAGSAYKGIGVPDCVRNGGEVADAVLDYLEIKAE
ncbi:MAG: protoporphyrinogen oxidase [Nitrospinaceae bacterium]|nr:protoporphyrinogen oxidase [Nitrospinaceae bacterium]NIR57306.1 protoporphyrinogen oxidase [Nitrospinaceae bacterium]NIS87758.1 protoporphyrinogen oxidase [Nitrospinaceae bacterium]NIT84628.1 protoporphyrinogen oxidase [Nitrospinaceae bacterium]NIU46807.1 protoporphyrinogen oxidase [Nitrospinaceae bacterium]